MMVNTHPPSCTVVCIHKFDTCHEQQLHTARPHPAPAGRGPLASWPRPRTASLLPQGMADVAEDDDPTPDEPAATGSEEDGEEEEEEEGEPDEPPPKPGGYGYKYKAGAGFFKDHASERWAAPWTDNAGRGWSKLEGRRHGAAGAGAGGGGAGEDDGDGEPAAEDDGGEAEPAEEAEEGAEEGAEKKREGLDIDPDNPGNLGIVTLPWCVSREPQVL